MTNQAVLSESFLDIIKAQDKKLLKTAVAVKVNDLLYDLSTQHGGREFSIIHADSPEGEDIIRHSTAHLLAMSVKTLFPKAQVTIGPVIENGFYYDFAYEPGFSDQDLLKIEGQMRRLAKKQIAIQRFTLPRDEASSFFRDLGEVYKSDIIDQIPANETLSLYRQNDFTDLCRGPHVPHTGFLKAFKLTKLAGAYWRGDSDNEMLQRIYGTAWATSEALDHYLKMQEEAKKRDHRRLGKQMDWFHLQEEAPGMIFWHPNGYRAYLQLEALIRVVYQKTGYQEIKTPQIIDRSLWEKSGHWDKYSENMFTIESEKQAAKRTCAVKPMSCPGHVQVFNQGLKSYKQLPVRYAEFGCCHRNEASGTLHGLLRVRSFVQDDGHIFCSMDQIGPEVNAFIEQTYAVYELLGFDQIILRLSTRPDQRVGSDEVWDKAENALSEILENSSYDYEILPGEGAFYGPKLEFSLKDCLGRIWQCGTIQVDFSTPERLDANFVNREGKKETPVMLHRAILGTFERFLGIMIEQCAGHMPFWLSPLQIVILPIGEEHHEYSNQLQKELESKGYRVEVDDRSEKVGYKIRQHTLTRTHFMLMVGDEEVQSGTVNVRDSQMKQYGEMGIDKLCEWLASMPNPIKAVENIF
ncbi:threonine--tRNA ligase [Gammaproteobacteria bacterium]|nr:threonine--tRNA ligase [Gammaproteobacteria bacterium]